MLLADMGADVVRLDRPGGGVSQVQPTRDPLRRSRRSVIVDLRQPEGTRVARALAARSDIVLEGFRPGTLEKLGLAPDVLWRDNPRLVIGRVTGWGQDGPLARSAGHDIGYIALTGALSAIGRPGEAPVPPVNLLGDFGGGATFLVIGVLAAVWEAARSGQGQVVDAAIVDGTSSLTAILHGLLASDRWQDHRGSNFLDGGVPWYSCYETADHEWMAVGALEPKFYAQLVDLLGLPASARERDDHTRWPALRQAIAQRFRERTRAEWTEIFDGTDACVAPVLSLTEAAQHPHIRARETFIDVAGVSQPAPAPRFGRTPSDRPSGPVAPGTHTRQVLTEAGIADVDELLRSGIVQEAPPAPNSR
jgi:alpha-methylacyl-CoA racemase